MKKEVPKVYVGMVADLLHVGHINILITAHAKGDVTVGLLTDDCVETYKRRPIQKWKDRKDIISAIRYVKDVIPQPTLDYTDNLLMLKPKYVVHGNDWKTGPQQKTREKEVLQAPNTVPGIILYSIIDLFLYEELPSRASTNLW